MKKKVENFDNLDLMSVKYKRAKDRVAQMQGFYYHLMVYLIINIAIVIIRPMAVNWFRRVSSDAQPEFFEWLDFNMLLTPVLWGIVLGAHYLAVFGFNVPVLRKWEQKQLKHFMDKERP